MTAAAHIDCGELRFTGRIAFALLHSYRRPRAQLVRPLAKQRQNIGASLDRWAKGRVDSSSPSCPRLAAGLICLVWEVTLAPLSACEHRLIREPARRLFCSFRRHAHVHFVRSFGVDMPIGCVNGAGFVMDDMVRHQRGNVTRTAQLHSSSSSAAPCPFPTHNRRQWLPLGAGALCTPTSVTANKPMQNTKATMRPRIIV